MARTLEPGETPLIQQTMLQIERRMERAPEGVTLALVSRLLNHWKNDRTDEEKDWLFDDWAEALEEFSADHLKAACKSWRENETFPPKIADIKAMCSGERAKDQIAHRRCRILLGLEVAKEHERLSPRQMVEGGHLLKPTTQQVEAPRALTHQQGMSLGEVLSTRTPEAAAVLREVNNRKS